MEEIITANDIHEQINKTYSPFFIVCSADLDVRFKPVIDSFLEAIDIIVPNINLNKTVQIIIGGSVFNVGLPNSNLKLEVRPEVINLYIDSMIFIDVYKMSNYRKEQQVVAVLEELVHVFMNVKDEDLVKKIVCCLYDKASYCNGGYLFNFE